MSIHILSSRVVNIDPTTVSPTIPPPPAGQITTKKKYFLQTGYFRNGMDENSCHGCDESPGRITLNDTFHENVWHKLLLVVDKDSNSSVQTFLDDKYVGSFRESLPPRDVGGVMALNRFRPVALFKDLKVERCLQFDLNGQCKYEINGSGREVGRYNGHQSFLETIVFPLFFRH